MGKVKDLFIDIEESGGFDEYIKKLEDIISKTDPEDEQYKKLNLYLALAKEWKIRKSGD